MPKLVVVFFLFFQAVLSAQVRLGPSISSGKLPADSSAICTFHTQTDVSNKFLKTGFHILDTVPDFTLFDTAGKPITLSKVCAEGKPVLLISVSYSCPRAREGLDDVLPFISSNFGTQLTILFIYTLEAHPIAPEVSPYGDSLISLKDNVRENIACMQHKTYGERKMLAKKLIAQKGVSIPVLLDGVCNEYLTQYGPSPNGAYLIRPDGVVFNHYGWFSKSKKQLSYDVYVLLNSLKKQPETKTLKAAIDSTNTLQVVGGKSYTIEIYTAEGELFLQKSESETVLKFPLNKYILKPGNYTIRVFSSAYEYELIRFVRN
jgi:hypothetical protein